MPLLFRLSAYPKYCHLRGGGNWASRDAGTSTGQVSADSLFDRAQNRGMQKGSEIDPGSGHISHLLIRPYTLYRMNISMRPDLRTDVPLPGSGGYIASGGLIARRFQPARA